MILNQKIIYFLPHMCISSLSSLLRIILFILLIFSIVHAQLPTCVTYWSCHHTPSISSCFLNFLYADLVTQYMRLLARVGNYFFMLSLKNSRQISFRRHFKKDSIYFFVEYHLFEKLQVIIPNFPPYSILIILQELLHPLFNPNLNMPIKDQVVIFYNSKYINKLFIQLLIQFPLLFSPRFHFITKNIFIISYFLLSAHSFIPFFIPSSIHISNSLTFYRINIQMSAEDKRQIVQYCKQINQKCQLDYDNFTFEDLKSRKWYLNILEILFPHLEQKIQQINKVVGQAKAIARLVQEINDLDQFENLDIDADKVAAGDVNQISNMVQVILALLEIVTDQYEEGQIESQQEVQNYKNNARMMFEQEKKQKKSVSDSQKPKSVQAIVNQFEKSEQQDEYSPTKNHLNNNFSPKRPDSQQHKFKQNFDEPYKKFPQKPTSGDKEKLNKVMDKNYNGNTNYTKTKLIDPEKQRMLFVSKTKKKLVTFPKSPETLKKAKSNQELALTRKIQQNFKTNKKNKKGSAKVMKVISPIEAEAKRKAKQYDYKQKMHVKQMIQNESRKNMKKNFAQKNEKNLQRMLKFKQEQLKKQRQEYEQSIKMKVMDQREVYIKKINNLIIELERQKQIQEKKDFKETLIKQNQEAVNKLKCLQQWYRNKLSMLKQNRLKKNNERMMLRSGHKEIIGKIEKQLKKENEQKLFQLTNKFRQEQNNIETDFEELKNKIIKVYHKY